MLIRAFDTECQALDAVTGFLQELQDTGRSLEGRRVTFDIDDTIIAAISEDPNPPLRMFWRACGLLGLERYIVTARPEVALEDGCTNRNATVQELASHGFGDYRGLYLMPPGCGCVSGYKQRARQAIVDDAREPLLLNIGDQWTDMALLADSELRRPFGRRYKSGKTYVGAFDDTSVLGVKLPEHSEDEQ